LTVKIAVISDLHFGFGRNTERAEDCWEAAEEAFEKAKDCDMIILPGDIFDEKIPRPEDWAKAMKLLSKIKVPVVAIHGTHERRGRGLINCVEGLEHAGFLKHLHCEHVVYEIKGKKIAVHGMSGVPEAYAKEVLQQWNPKPVEGAFNIFMLHQSIHPYIYNPIEPPSLRLEDLPEGFDLYISGHIHWREKTQIRGKPFIIPGSLIPTQINKTEAKYPKGFFVVELNENVEIKFVELENQRKVFYKEFKVNNENPSEILERIEEYLDGIEEDKKPLVRIKVTGRIEKGTSLDLSYIREKYKDKLLLSLSVRVEEEEIENKIKLLRSMRESKESVEEMGMKILRENLKELNLSKVYEEIFDFLVEGNVDGALVHLLSEREEKEEEEEEKVKVLDREEFERELFEEEEETKPKKTNLLAWAGVEND